MRGLHESKEYEALFSCRYDEHDFAYDGWEADPQRASYVLVQTRRMVRTPGKVRGGMATRDPLGRLKDCMQHTQFSELSKRLNELFQQCETTLREAVSMERQRIWQELMPKWFSGFKLQCCAAVCIGVYRCDDMQ